MNVSQKARIVVRAIGFLGTLALAFVLYPAWVLTRPEHQRRTARARWLQRICQQHLRTMGVDVTVEGQAPTEGILVSNHVSYFDIVVLCASAPVVFIAKKEIRSWPIFGIFAYLSGSLFIDRQRRGSVAGVAEQMREALNEGAILAVFPEGTTSDGSTVLPFKPSLFEPVAELGCPVTTAAVSYSLEGGCVRDEVHWWGEMELGSHLLHAASKKRIDATLRFGESSPRFGDRKMIARELHHEVLELYRGVEEPELALH